MYRSILVATDGSDYALRAVTQAALLAKMSKAKLVLFHAAPHVHMPSYSEGLDIRRPRNVEEEKKARDAAAKAVLAAARKEIRVGDVEVEEAFEVADDPHAAILDAAAKHGVDLIVMAPHGHHGIAGVLLGSVTQKVLTHARMPVLVVS